MIKNDAIFEDQFGFTQLLSGFRQFMNQKLNIRFKNDIDIMRQVLEQNLNNKEGHCWSVVIMEKSLRILLDEVVIVEEAHNNYDTELAMEFTKMAFKKMIYYIEIEFESEKN